MSPNEQTFSLFPPFKSSEYTSFAQKRGMILSSAVIVPSAFGIFGNKLFARCRGCGEIDKSVEI